MKKLIEGLKHFQEHILWERREQFERSVEGQRPHALLITCSDSRVLPETLMQADPGDLFVSRNAGNLVPPPDAPSGEAATIEYAVSALGVTDIIVCGHYRCGAVQAILDPGKASELTKTQEWLRFAAEPGAAIRKSHPELDSDALWDKAVEQNVLAQVRNLARHPVVARGLAAQRIRLHGWVLRFETGEVLTYNPLKDAFTPLVEEPIVYPILPMPGAPAVRSAHAKLRSIATPPRRTGFRSFLADVSASLVVFAVALPLCIAIARACGLPTATGLIAAIVGGAVVGCLGGGSLQVSGPTAGLIVILLDVIEQRGLAGYGAVVLLAGMIQLCAGFLRLGQWFRAISPAVVLGMLAGIGVVLFAQQFHATVDDAPARSAVMNLVRCPQAVLDVFDGHEGHPEHQDAALIGVLTLMILLLWKRLAPRRLSSIPPVLVAIVISTSVTAMFQLPIQRVEFESLTSGLKVPHVQSLWGLLADGLIWQLAFTVAVVASSETLLTAAAVDQMHSGSRTAYDRELAAQGVGNILCGMLGALPIASVIVRSSANVQAGARSRWSTVLHAAWLCAFAVLAPSILRAIPTAALAAILVLTGIKLVQHRAIRSLWRESREEGLILIAVTITVIATDLLTSVIVGVVLSAMRLMYAFSRLRIAKRGDPENGQTTLVLQGSATFLRLPKLAAALEELPTGIHIHIDVQGLSYIDHACLRLLENWETRHAVTGGTLALDWETLRSRFRRERPRPRLRRRPTQDASVGPDDAGARRRVA